MWGRALRKARPVSSLPALARQLRRKLLAKPGFSRLPICQACLREVEPSDLRGELCGTCRAERDRASAEWDAQCWAEANGGSIALPAEPMYGGDEGAAPFLPDDEDDD
jgi:hypothetical protein